MFSCHVVYWWESQLPAWLLLEMLTLVWHVLIFSVIRRQPLGHSSAGEPMRPIHFYIVLDILITEKWAEIDKQGNLLLFIKDCIDVHWDRSSFSASPTISFMTRFDNYYITDNNDMRLPVHYTKLCVALQTWTFFECHVYCKTYCLLYLKSRFCMPLLLCLGSLNKWLTYLMTSTNLMETLG